MRRRRLIMATVVSAALALAGCGNSSDQSGQSSTAAGTTPMSSTAAPTTASSAPSTAGSQSAGSADSSAPSAGGSGSAAPIVLPDNIKSKGAIDVGVYFNYPPYTYAEGGTLKGIEADLINAVGAKLGVKVNFHDLAFEAMIPSVANGRMDMLIGPMGDTADRRQVVQFIDLYREQYQALVKKGNPNHFDIDNPCGAKGGEVAASNNLTTEQWLSKKCTDAGKPAISILSLPDNGGVFQAIMTGRSDFSVQVQALAKYMIATTPGLEFQGKPFPSPNSEFSGWVVGKDNKALATALTSAINALIADGTWGKIMKDAGITESAVPAPLINGEPAGQ